MSYDEYGTRPGATARSQSASAARYGGYAGQYGRRQGQAATAQRYTGLANRIQIDQQNRSNAASAARWNGLAGAPPVMPAGPAGRPTPTPKPTPKPTPDGALDGSGTDPSKNYGDPPKYPTEPRPLNAEELAALADRRLAIDNAYKEALAQKEQGEGATRARGLAERQLIDRDFKRSSQDFMSAMASRGLARSPMFAGKGMRQMQQDRESNYGQVEDRVSSEISALEEMVNKARIERDMELARISQDEAFMRSDPWSYLMLASQYLGG